MSYQYARFHDNGNCGYVLKPRWIHENFFEKGALDMMLTNESSKDNNNRDDDNHAIFDITIYGCFLPHICYDKKFSFKSGNNPLSPSRRSSRSGNNNNNNNNNLSNDSMYEGKKRTNINIDNLISINIRIDKCNPSTGVRTKLAQETTVLRVDLVMNIWQ